MRSTAGLATLLGILGFGGTDSVNFDAARPGAAPPNWSFVSALGGPRPRWEVRYDPSAPSRSNVLEQVNGSSKESESPVAIFDKVVCRDGDLSVKFKIEGHGKGRSAGLVWRYQDPSNYYLLHVSADEKNIALFRVKNSHSEALPIFAEGKPLGAKVSHDIQPGQWYVAKITFRGAKIRVVFGNRHLFDAEDSELGGAGKTGVWTHGKTTAAFDDFRIDKKS